MMNNIEWKEGAVCYADSLQYKIIDGKCYYYSDIDGNWCSSAHGIDFIINRPNFQLNKPKEGDYLPKSELDTEQKYNDAVEVFGLFGCVCGEQAYDKYDAFELGEILIWSRGLHQAVISHDMKNRKLTYNQLMAIGKLKRLMNERKDEESTIQDAFDAEPKPNKSKQAYDILKSLDYEYDLVKQCWYRKEYIK